MAHRNRWFTELKDGDVPVRYVNVCQRLPSISIVMIDLPDRFDDEFLMFFWLSFHYVQLYPNTPYLYIICIYIYMCVCIPLHPHSYSSGHVWVITSAKWHYTFYKWGFLSTFNWYIKGHNCIPWTPHVFPLLNPRHQGAADGLPDSEARRRRTISFASRSKSSSLFARGTCQPKMKSFYTLKARRISFFGWSIPDSWVIPMKPGICCWAWFRANLQGLTIKHGENMSNKSWKNSCKLILIHL